MWEDRHDNRAHGDARIKVSEMKMYICTYVFFSQCNVYYKCLRLPRS
jgi:hypothetical protein